MVPNWRKSSAKTSQRRSFYMGQSFINNLNINQLKIFECVYRLKSMTLAAQELFLTQSGVSQHIKSFEESLEITLFIRNRTMLFATYEADVLYKTCQKSFAEINQTLNEIKNPDMTRLEGRISIGMPTEFGNNIVIPQLAEWSKKNPLVKFDFFYGYGTHLVGQLQAGELDLAFVDSLQKNKKLISQVLYRENLNLVASTSYMKEKKIKFRGKETLKQLLHLDFLEYEHKESILRMWFQYHYSKKNIGLNIRAWAMNVQGLASLIRHDMGVAVLPDHLTQLIIKEGTGLHIFKGTKPDLKNEISLAWLKERPLSAATADLKKYFLGNPV